MIYNIDKEDKIYVQFFSKFKSFFSVFSTENHLKRLHTESFNAN